MNKKYLFRTLLFAGATLFAACDYNEDNFDGWVEGHVPTDIKKIEYTLTAEDYKSISTDRASKDTATAHQAVQSLGRVGKLGCFNDSVTAQQYVPMFLAKKYFTADNGSAVKVTYERELGMSSELQALNKATSYKVSNEEYEEIWGAAYPFFTPVETPAKHVPALLKAAKADAKAGDVVLVDYNLSDTEPAGAVVAVNQTFEGAWAESSNEAVVDGWLNVATKGSYVWNGKIFNNNSYIQASAFNHEGESEIYMISPRFTVHSGMQFTFDACYGHYMAEGGRVTVCLLETTDDLSTYSPEEIAAAKWVDITDDMNIVIPDGKYGVLAPAYDYDLSAYKGKKVYVAFRYNGNGSTKATTTVQIDNVLIKSEGSSDSENVVYASNGVYKYDGEKWAEYAGVYSMKKADFAEMGSNFDNFSSSMKPAEYLPLFLAQKYPYALEGDVKTIVYKYYSNKQNSVRADEFVLTAGEWIPAAERETVTDQFVLSNGVWNYDPSVTITLLPTKNDLSIKYYQAVTDWVWENIDKAKLNISEKGKGYVTSYGNNEYYTGCSAYYGNIDMRADKAKAQYPDGYKDMSDAEIVKAMEEHLFEAMEGTLAVLHPEAAPIPGVQVCFTFRVGVYTGVQITDCTHELKFEVVAPGKFKYVEGSYQPLAK